MLSISAMSSGRASSPIEADVGVEEVAGEDVIARAGAALFEALGEVVLEFDDGAGAFDFALAGEEAAEGRHGVVGPVALEAVHIGAVDAEGVGDDGERERDGELADELDFAVADEAVDEVAGDGGDGGSSRPGDAACGEGFR
ncbi:hypothetical protein O0235_06010 [Tepidiforma flava]|uniref:Uncharacterized protein n=1 Tax=Tepidiforma flava TaxID=3004094 RepID=A0ABY7MAL4_9CHLR|nr:hypothetical protein [Tepidiforma flava]WBL37120.1 hypothetical protein O0235_06010 [Tepidiforma flava]